MPLFGQKKSRSSRTATIKLNASPLARLHDLLRNRSVLLRVGLCVLATLAMVVVVEGWEAPFPYRLGDRADHGITAKIDFKRINRFETDKVKSEREARVPFIFVNNPEALSSLPAKLRVALTDIAQAPKLENLTPQTRAAFGLTIPDAPPGTTMPDEMNHEFMTLKAAVAREDAATGHRIDDLLAEFERFIAPLRFTGVADPQELTRNGITADRMLAIVATGDEPTNPRNWDIVSAEEVQLPELLKDTGRLGKSWTMFPELVVFRPLLERWLLSQSPVTLRYDSNATQIARRDAREIEDQYDVYNANDVLLEPGAVVDEQTLAILLAEHEQLEQVVPRDQRIARVVTVFLLVVVLAALNGYYLLNHEPHLVRNAGRLSIYLGSILLAVLLGRLLSFDPWRAEVIPLVATVMVFAIAYNQVLATLMAFTLTLLIAMFTVGDLAQFVVLMSVAATAVIPLRRVPSRSTLIKVGLLTGVAYFLASWGTGIVANHSDEQVWSDPTLVINSLKGAGWCLVAGYLVAGSLPFIEKIFGVVTDISLLEMSDISHPLLHELVRRAPGTYNHSIAVATIAETAADKIGANGLLVRVGAYFHDIGKMLKPHYFVENMTDGSESRHTNLAPAMSTLIIIGHVKDGVDLARQHNLPEPLINFIEQHHGTTLVEYFYREAARLAGQSSDHRTDAEESSFRYPGPKPQSREAAVLMLADAVESASRTLSEPAPKRIESLVHEIAMKRLLDGQFDESTLTLSELHTIEESLTKSLIGIYHGRIKYPEQRTA